MTKNEFLSQLANRLCELCEEDRMRSLDYYAEMIDDRIEEGMTEADAVSNIGTPEDVAAQILMDTPRRYSEAETVEDTVKAKSASWISPWMIVLIVLGAPLWLSLLIGAASILLSVYIVIWSVVISLWSAAVTIVGTGIGAVIGSIGCFVLGDAGTAVFMIGGGLVLLGLSIFAFMGCSAVSKLVVKATKELTSWLVSLFRKRRAAK